MIKLTFANLHNLEAGEKLADHKGSGADNVERNDDQGQLDSLDLGPGYDHRGGSEQKLCYTKTQKHINKSNVHC